MRDVPRTATFADQTRLLEHGEHHTKLARGHTWHGDANLVDGQCIRYARRLQPGDEGGEIIRSRIPSRHEEALQAAVAPLKQQNAGRRLAVPSGAARFLVVDVQ